MMNINQDEDQPKQQQQLQQLQGQLEKETAVPNVSNTSIISNNVVGPIAPPEISEVTEISEVSETIHMPYVENGKIVNVNTLDYTRCNSFVSSSGTSTATTSPRSRTHQQCHNYNPSLLGDIKQEGGGHDNDVDTSHASHTSHSDPNIVEHDKDREEQIVNNDEHDDSIQRNKRNGRNKNEILSSPNEDSINSKTYHDNQQYNHQHYNHLQYNQQEYQNQHTILASNRNNNYNQNFSYNYNSPTKQPKFYESDYESNSLIFFNSGNNITNNNNNNFNNHKKKKKGGHYHHHQRYDSIASYYSNTGSYYSNTGSYYHQIGSHGSGSGSGAYTMNTNHNNQAHDPNSTNYPYDPHNSQYNRQQMYSSVYNTNSNDDTNVGNRNSNSNNNIYHYNEDSPPPLPPTATATHFNACNTNQTSFSTGGGSSYSKNNDNHIIHHNNDNNNNSNNNNVLPYYKRKLLQEQQQLQEQQLQYRSELSTINYINTKKNDYRYQQHINSPPSPSPLQHQPLPPPLHPNSKSNIKFHNFSNNDDSPTMTTKIPTRTLHLRHDSTGSISSLGSITGGASTISRWKGGGEKDDEEENKDDEEEEEESYRCKDRNQKEKMLYNKNDNILDGHYNNKRPNHNSNDTTNVTSTTATYDYEEIGKTGSGFLSSILGSISMSSAGSVNSLDDQKADFHKKNQKFLKMAEEDRERQMKLYGIHSRDFAIRTTLRSLSPIATGRSHRPKLPSIDNDDWGEGGSNDHKNKKSRSEHAKPVTKHFHNYTKSNNSASRPPKQMLSTNYFGSTTEQYPPPTEKTHLVTARNSSNDFGMDTTRKIYNTVKTNNFYSDDSESDSDDSSVSSDFTSNQKDNDSSYFSIDYNSNHDRSSDEEEDSSVFAEDGTEPGSSDNLSYDADNRNDFYSARNERTSVLQTPGETNIQSSHKRRAHEVRALPRRKDRRRKKKTMRHDQRNRSRKRSYDSKSYYQRSSYPERMHGYGGFDEYRRFDDRRTKKMLDKKERMYRELKAEVEFLRKREEERDCCHRLSKLTGKCWERTRMFASDIVNFVSNLPLTIGAIALAIVTLGIAWFNFAEEMMSSCQPVHFHSSQCNLSEFPGCFYCDTSARMYKMAWNFHVTCSIIAGVIALLFVAKIFIARDVVMDEMKSPTTASPAGLLCMTLVCVFAGKGLIGEIIVSFVATLHFCIAVWFIHMAVAYNILPDPSWYPNTVGIGISALKMWLYHPVPGHLLMATCLSLYTFFFPISLVRVTVNKKLSAPVSWIQMSAPAAALCALTIMAQPSFEEEYPDITNFQRVHRMLYIPVMHFLFSNCIIGAISSVQSLISRWDRFIQKEFSPAHAAFCFPTLAHANSIQAYRSAINSFSGLHTNTLFMNVLNIYWIFVLTCGSLATLFISIKFFYMLPSWTKVDVENEMEPPAPNETIMSEVILAGQTLRQDLVSAAVLQANEAGVLVRVPGREGRSARYARTRKVTALGFEPIMDLLELNEERDKLLEWVAKNPPRPRKRTMSVPGITKNIADFGANNRGVYGGGLPPNRSADRRLRAQTSHGNDRLYDFL